MKHTLKTFLLAFVAMMVPIVGWGQTNVSTSYLPYATAIPDGSFAYTVAGVDGDYLDLKQIEGSLILANTPVILAKSELPNSGVANASASEYLLGTLVNQSVTIETGYSYFQLNVEDTIWYKVTEESFANDAGKAYLKFPDSMVAGKEKLYTIKEDAPQNSCGENLTWTLTDGELVIEGTGAMYNFEDEAAPWFASKDEIVKLTIKSGVTSVGNYAFNKCDKITDVVISNGVTTLGTHAFGYCDGLTVVSLPPSVKTIGWSAFYTCQNLTTVNLSEGVTRIGEYSFADCRNLSKLNIPEGVTEIGQWAFRKCSFTSLILPSTLKTIQSYAFFDCYELTSLTCLATTPPGLWNEAFATMNLSVPIYVPSGSVDAYKSKEQWNAFTILSICSSESDHNFVNGICTKCGAYEPAVDSNSDGTYEIGNAGQLFWFAEKVNADNFSIMSVVLTADIDLENRLWTPIAHYSDHNSRPNRSWRGTLDGQNHVIKNLNVHVTDGSEAGLFSRGFLATLRNFGVINATVINDSPQSVRAGVVAGEFDQCTVSNVFSAGNLVVITSNKQKGGIAGECHQSPLTNCYTTYDILTDTNVHSATNCFYLADEANASSAGTAVTAAQMASGEVAYKLGNAYGQTIGSDALPVFGGAKVNYGYVSCVKGYTNAEVSDTPLNHNYENGICSVCGTYEAATDSNGDGTYEIGNAGQLFWFAEYVNSGNYSARAVLTADIDLENRPWTPIGYFNDAVDPYIDLHYRGIFDGQNHIIKNLNVHITDGSEAGFFSRTRDASLRNFGIVNATVISDPLGDKSSRAGVVGGELHYTTVDNVYTCGNITVITEYPQKGGIAGESSATRLNNCYTTYGILTPTKDVSVNNCFYLGNETNASSAGSFMTVEQMASGEMAYKLGNAYGQTIGTDAYPVLGGAKVNYGYISCTATEKAYSNSEVRETQGHNYIDGVCEHCSEVTEARWGTSLANLTQAGTLKEALAAAMSGSANYILMQKDVAGITTNADPYLYITGGDFTLDLNGCSLTCDVYGPNVRGGANLIITDTSANKDGELIGIYGNITVKDATVSILEGTIRDGLMLVHSGGRLNISGGTIATNAIRTNEGAVATISGGTLTNKRLYYSGGKVDLSTYTDLPGIQVRYELDTPTVIGPETILLPDDCGIFDEDGVLTEILSGDLSDYTIAKLPTIWYTVNFDANGGVGEMEDANANGKYRLPECTFTAPEGKMFKAWSVNEVEYQPNAVITVAGNTTITAVWATPYTLAFSANGGVGSLVALKTLSTLTLPECPFLAPEGKEFKAWRIGENEYAAGSVATLTEDAVAYAVWNDAYSELEVDIMPMFPDAGEGTTVRIMRDGIEIDRVEIMVAGEHAHRWIPYDSNHEYTFYWESRLGVSSWDVDVEIHLGPERIFREFGHNLEHEYRDRPFLTIPAKSSAGSTLETLNIIDGELPEYNVLREAEVGTLTYQRTLPNLEWNALFLPFEIPLSELEADYEVAYFNDMHAYDRNTDGQIDELEMEIILLSEGTLHANHPYLIRAKSEAAKELNLSLTDATIYNTEDRTTITCSSAYMNFELVGVYEQKTAAELDGCYAITTEGVWAPVAAGAVLNPFRLYLNMEARSGSPVKVNPAALSKIRIRKMGDSVATDIDAVGVEGAGKQVIYDLSGRRVENPGKGLYIVNGKKVMMK